jgi:hypothetical protein
MTQLFSSVGPASMEEHVIGDMAKKLVLWGYLAHALGNR